MNRMGRNMGILLCRLLAICILAVAASAILTIWMTEDFRKTLTEHDAAAAGYLIGHPDANPLCAFTKEKTESDLMVGKRELGSVGYGESTDPGLIPDVARYRMRIAAIFGGLLSAVFAGIFLTFHFYRKKQKAVLEKANAVITCFLEGDGGQRIECEETGDWYSLFHRINELAAVLSSHADHEKQSRRFLQDMISDVSHQLKTPLAAMKMYHEIIAQDDTDAETIREFSRKSLREIGRVEDVVYTLLKIARLDTGTVRMEKEEESVEALLRDVTERFEVQAAKEAKEIILSGQSGATLYCDALWMSEALGNVIKNALEHTKEGGKILVSWERTALLTNIIIEDNGTGIHPEDIHNIFKRFYRSRFSQDTHGIGLGLPLAKAVVEAHDGTVTVTSRPGQGSRFVLSFFHCIKE